jgi:hypothetical protein
MAGRTLLNLVTIFGYFEGLNLIEFSCGDDSGRFRENIDTVEVVDSNYSCGLFWFTKNR